MNIRNGQYKTRKAHKSRVFIINPLSAKLIFVRIEKFHVCVYVYLYVCLYVCMHLCVCAYICACMRLWLCQRSVATYVCLYVCVCVHVCLFTCASGFARGLSVESVCVHVCLFVCASGFARGLSVDSVAGAVYQINTLVYTGP